MVTWFTKDLGRLRKFPAQSLSVSIFFYYDSVTILEYFAVSCDLIGCCFAIHWAKDTLSRGRHTMGIAHEILTMYYVTLW